MFASPAREERSLVRHRAFAGGFEDLSILTVVEIIHPADECLGYLGLSWIILRVDQAPNTIVVDGGCHTCLPPG